VVDTTAKSTAYGMMIPLSCPKAYTSLTDPPRRS
jgi:hypothetical protein